MCQINLQAKVQLNTYDLLNTVIHEPTEIHKTTNLLTEDNFVVHIGSTSFKLDGTTNMVKVGYI